MNQKALPSSLGAKFRTAMAQKIVASNCPMKTSAAHLQFIIGRVAQ